MNKKNIIVNLLIIIVFLVSVGCNKNLESNTENLSDIKRNDINPISKETVINILKSEYGDNIIIEENNIKLIGDLYFVEVYVEIKEENEEGHKTHTHRESLGTQKIDKYTGELIIE